jgi:flagellar hook-associated protein 2
MGTIGLNFGTPTSGAGFNVSSTVAEIVSNLQNVETPWKNQLSALESQDTAISSLGTLFSNLSNDISSLTDFQGILAQKEGSSSNTNVLELTAATSAATAGTHTVVVQNLAQTSSGYLDVIAKSSDVLSGSISIQVGNGTAENIVIGAAPATPAANTVYTGAGNNTLSALQSAINGAGLGVTANVLTDANGSRLSLVSGTSGSAGQLTITSSLTDANSVTTKNPTGAINFNSTVTGINANMIIDGVPLTSPSNTVSNYIPGVTFQLLSPSPTESDGTTQEPIQVVIGNDNTAVESTVNQFVSDYNALVSAINTQEGNTSSGTPEPLFGTPTLSLLQQQLLSSINVTNPTGYLDAINNSSDALTGSISISFAGGLPLNFSTTAGTATQASSGTLSAIANAGDTLSGSISIQVGNGAAQTVNVGDSSTPDTLAGLAAAINTAHIGVRASVVTNSDGSSSLSLLSGTSGTAGNLTVTSSIADTSPQSINVPTSSGNNTLSGLASAINASHSGVTANVVTNSTGSQLELFAGAAGASGALSVVSSISDATTNTALSYNNSGTDISNLTALGISENNDGTLTFDASTLDSLLNTDYSGVTGFFQGANSWGQNFSTMLSNAGTSSANGVLSLAESANSSVESSLNAEISKEQSYISTQQSSLTAELNQANQVLQQLPTELTGINELYSAITGFNQNNNG